MHVSRIKQLVSLEVQQIAFSEFLNILETRKKIRDIGKYGILTKQ